MKFTKRLAAIAACTVMATSCMVGTAASAAGEYNDTAVSVTDIYSSNEETYSTNATTVTSTLHKLKYSFPHYQQAENSFYCWAECARAIINYNLGTSYTCDNMVSTALALSLKDPAFSVGVNGSANAETTFGVIGDYLGPYGYMTALTGTPLSASELKYQIDNDVPVLMCLQNASHTVGHMVVITGYGTAKYDYPSLGIYTGDITGLYYMDPMTGTESFHTYIEKNGNFSVTVNNSQTGGRNVTLEWTRAIYSWKYFN